MSPTPIVVIGRLPKILEKARQDLMPEYDAIHMLNDADRGAKDLPLLLSDPSQTPEDTHSNLGSQNYSTRPRAVAVGGAFDDAMFNKMKDACKDVDKGIFWIRADTSQFGTMPSLSDTDAFGAVLAKRLKAKLNELGVGSGSSSIKGEVYYF